MIYLICYDIADPKRLRKVAKILEGHGIRTQYSVFQCDLPSDLYNELVNRLRSYMDETKDRLYCYPVCGKCIKKSITQGTGELMRLKSFEIL